MRAVCAPRCALSARLSVFNLHGNHGLAWSCSVEDSIGPCWLAVVSMHMDIASMVLAVRAGCAPRCAQSARLSVFNLHGNHGLAWSCSAEDYRALLACCG